VTERIQSMWLSEAISQSIWGFPIVGALHVLAIALFAGTLLVSVEVQWLKRIGLTVLLVTGVLLFMSGAVRYYDSIFFRIKMVLLVLILLNAWIGPRKLWVSLTLWAAVIFAARGIAFY
jgi:hypothetical protein